MNMRNTLQLSTIAVLLAGGVNLIAQTTTGALRGQVTDEAGKPIKGARVSLESPALFQTRVFTTDAEGMYRALLLPVGNYVVKVSAEGKLGKSASDVRIGVGSNLALPFVLKSTQAAAAVVEVIGNSAAESKTSDKISVNYSSEQLLKMPVSMQGFDSITNIAPGVAGYGTAARVRGSDTNQILYSIDGINVKDDSGKAASLYAPLPDSIEDVQVVASSLNARSGLVSGGQVNMVTKSGSNTFEGSVRANMSRASLGSDFALTNASNNSNLLREDLTHTTDVIVSGPIVKDRLWFTLGTRFTPSQATTGLLGYTVQGVQKNSDGSTSILPWSQVRTMLHPMSTYGLNPGVDSVINAGPGGGYAINTEDAGTQLSNSIRFRKLEGKLTGMLTADHSLSLTLLNESTTQGGVQGQKNTDPWEGNILRGIGEMKTETKAYTLAWNGVLAPNWTIEARTTYAAVSANDVPNPTPGVAVAGYFASGSPNLRLRGESGPHSWLADEGYNYGPLLTNMSTYVNPEKRGNQTTSVNLKTIQAFNGSHDIDLGGEKVTTLYNFGRTKFGNRGVFTGGWVMNAAGQYLYPVFRRGAQGTDPTEILQIGPGENPSANGWTAWDSMPNGLGTQSPFLHWEAIRGPSAHMERFYDNPGDSKNSTTSFYVNDNWTVNSQWNVMLGARYNKLVMQDQGGNQLNDMSVFEPRFLLKFNPDGSNKEVYSFSMAKLASAYSDAVANNFRGNAWEVRTVHLWSGAGLGIAQPGFDTAAAGTDAPVGTYNGYTYTGQNMSGVRWVNYATLTDTANYGPAYDMLDARQTYLAKGLKAPYAVEFGIGYQRNYDSGYFRINGTRRTYKDNIIGPIHDYGMASMVHMVSPAPNDPLRMWKQATIWRNSEFDRIYTGLEMAFQKQLSSRWSVMGSFTMDQSTGTNDLDYYNYKTLREKLLTPAQQNAAVGHGVLSRNQIAHLFLTYTVPVGAGNVSFSFKADTWQGGVIQAQGWTDYRTLSGFSALQLPTTIGGERVIDVDQRTGNWQTFFPTYAGDMGAFKSGVDYYQFGAKIQWDIPIGVGKVRMIGYVSLDNLFNHMIITNIYGYFTGDSPNQNNNVAPGSPMALFYSGRAYGQTPGDVGAKYGDYNQGFGGRRVGDFSFGFKF